MNKLKMAIYAVILGLYHLLVIFVLKPEFVSWWPVYVFTLLAFIVSFSVAFLMNRDKRGNGPESWPLSILPDIYIIIQIIISFISGRKLHSVKASVIGEFFLLGLILIIFLLLYKYRSSILNDKEKRNQKRQFITELKLVLDDDESLCSNTDGKKAVRKAIDIVRYSDPMSSDELNGIEDAIMRQCLYMKDCIESWSKEETEKYCADIVKELKRRNDRCLMLK